MAWTCVRCRRGFRTNLYHAAGETCTTCYRSISAAERAAIHGESAPGRNEAPIGLFAGFPHGPLNAASKTLMGLAWLFLIIGFVAAFMVIVTAGAVAEEGGPESFFMGILAAGLAFLEWLFRSAVCAGLALGIEAAVRARRPAATQE